MTQDSASEENLHDTILSDEQKSNEPGRPLQLLTIIRHGKRMDDVDDQWRFSALRPWDPPLWNDGLAAVRSTAAQLSSRRFDRMVVSPFQRCLQTAKELNSILKIPLSHIQIDRAVCEVLDPKVLVGSQLQAPTGAASDWMWGPDSLDDSLYAVFGTDAAEVSIGGGPFPKFPETITAAHFRYFAAFEDIAGRFPGEKILVVSHGEAVGQVINSTLPQMLVYEVAYCGFATMFREQDSVDMWGSWRLSVADCQGVHWTI